MRTQGERGAIGAERVGGVIRATQRWTDIEHQKCCERGYYGGRRYRRRDPAFGSGPVGIIIQDVLSLRSISRPFDFSSKHGSVPAHDARGGWADAGTRTVASSGRSQCARGCIGVEPR